MSQEESIQSKIVLQSKSTNIILLYIHSGVFLYVEIINKLIVGIIDGLYAFWKIISSEEAIKVYVIIGKILFFFIVIAITILTAIVEAENKRRRRRY